jgi:hypothetical protein
MAIVLTSTFHCPSANRDATTCCLLPLLEYDGSAKYSATRYGLLGQDTYPKTRHGESSAFETLISRLGSFC